MWCLLLDIIFGLVFIILAVDLTIVLLSYSMCWCEYANAQPQLMQERSTWKNLRLAVWLILQEMIFNLLALATLPFGLTRPLMAPRTKGETPILLLHGIFHNRASWFWLKMQLRFSGYKNVTTINLSAWHNEETLTELVAKEVDKLRHRLGVEKVHLIGHSMGGIIARNYIQIRGGAEKIDRCVTIGSPHLGSRLAPVALSPLGRLLIPGSEFLERLANAPIPKQVSFTNIYSIKDNIVLPNGNACLPWGNSVELDQLGHTALLYRAPAINAIINALQ